MLIEIEHANMLLLLNEHRDMLADAEKNLQYAGLFDKDSDYEGAIGHAVMDLLRKFHEQRHSGGSAMLTTELFSRLIQGHALTKRYWDEKSAELRQFYRVMSNQTQAPMTPANENYFVKLCLGECPNE